MRRVFQFSIALLCSSRSNLKFGEIRLHNVKALFISAVSPLLSLKRQIAVFVYLFLFFSIKTISK